MGDILFLWPVRPVIFFDIIRQSDVSLTSFSRQITLEFSTRQEVRISGAINGKPRIPYRSCISPLPIWEALIRCQSLRFFGLIDFFCQCRAVFPLLLQSPQFVGGWPPPLLLDAWVRNSYLKKSHRHRITPTDLTRPPYLARDALRAWVSRVGKYCVPWILRWLFWTTFKKSLNLD